MREVSASWSICGHRRSRSSCRCGSDVTRVLVLMSWCRSRCLADLYGPFEAHLAGGLLLDQLKWACADGRRPS